ncbi:MAG: hypothetical protein JXB38_03470 [Anaerolineales bacterium]|nr:hypothetical protein [Anaerolineales bacterium]
MNAQKKLFPILVCILSLSLLTGCSFAVNQSRVASEIDETHTPTSLSTSTATRPIKTETPLIPTLPPSPLPTPTLLPKEPIRTFPIEGEELAYSSDGTMLALSQARIETILLIDPLTGDTLRSVDLHPLKGLYHTIFDMTFSHDDKWLAAGGNGHAVYFYDVITGEEINGTGAAGDIIDVDFSYNDEFFSFVHTFGPAYAQILYSKGQIDPDYFKIELPASLTAYSIAFSPLEPLLVTGSYNNTASSFNSFVQIWDLAPCINGEACEPDLVAETKLINPNGFVKTTCFTQPGELTLHIGNELWKWNYITNEKKTLLYEAKPVEKLICNQSTIGLVYENGDFLLIEPTNNTTSNAFKIDSAIFDSPYDIELSPDGTELAVAAFDHPLRIWELR